MNGRAKNAQEIARASALLSRLHRWIVRFMDREQLRPGEQMSSLLSCTAYILAHHAGTDANFDSALGYPAGEGLRSNHRYECAICGRELAAEEPKR